MGIEPFKMGYDTLLDANEIAGKKAAKQAP